MRTLLIVAWLFTGLGGVIYHYGPGREKIALEQTEQKIDLAESSADDARWDEAVFLYETAIAELPADQKDAARRLTLEKCKAQMMAAKLPDARQELQTLLDDLRGDDSASPELVAEVRSTLANSQYYMAWLMRLEGLTEAEWMPEIESSRQHYAQLLDESQQIDDAEVRERMTQRSREDLESAVRLARMDLGELQGLPLPNQ